MILAAGYGRRMRPLTDKLPKPLLTVRGKPLIVYRIEALVAAGIEEIIINHSYLGAQIESVLGDGSRYGARLVYSAESEPLETGGGICKALPLLGSEPFIVCNGDVWTDYSFENLLCREVGLAHLVMVKNPGHHSTGDFFLDSDGAVCSKGDTRGMKGMDLTYAGISLLSPQLFSGVAEKRFPLLDPLLKAMALKQISGEFFDGCWVDVGTPQRLQQLEAP